MILNKFINEMKQKQAASMHLSAGLPPLFNIHGRLTPLLIEKLNAQEIDEIAGSLMNPHQKDRFRADNSINFTWAIDESERIRITFFRQKGLISGVFRPMAVDIPTIEDLNLPSQVRNLAYLRHGLVVIGGPTGSGKSTTLAAILNEINHNRRAHVVTIEDPIEYYFPADKSLFSQREIGIDSPAFPSAMREAIRQDADVIMLGEMRDVDTIRLALNAAETGILVLGTMATSDCVQTLTRLISSFPPNSQHQARTQVATVIKAILTQQLVMRADGSSRLPAVEIMFSTQAIRNLIRLQKFHQVYSIIENNNDAGMQTLDQSLQRLFKGKVISDLEVVTKSVKPEQAQRKMDSGSLESIPEPETGPGFVDVGEDIIPIEKKMILYRANFTPGLEGAWTSSVAVIFQDPGLILSNPPGAPTNRLYVSDFNIVSKKVNPFALPHRLLLRFKLEYNEETYAKDQQSEMLIKLFTQPEKDKPTAYHKANLSFPLNLDNKWHTWVITIPDYAFGKMLKITMLEFPLFLTKVSISDIIFF